MNNISDLLLNIKNSDDVSYSSIMRDLRKNFPDKVNLFMKCFKKAFDEACDGDLENPDRVALLSAIKSIKDLQSYSTVSERMYKLAASAIQMGDPKDAGKGIAEIVKFLLKRIDPVKRPKSIQKLRHKIWKLDEIELANKKTPNSASMGQSITFIKTILIGHNPVYIRSVLTEIVRNLY